MAVCLSGGEKEVAVLNAELQLARRHENKPLKMGAVTVERQCDQEFLSQLDTVADDHDAFLSMACGVCPSGHPLRQGAFQRILRRLQRREL